MAVFKISMEEAPMDQKISSTEEVDTYLVYTYLSLSSSIKMVAQHGRRHFIAILILYNYDFDSSVEAPMDQKICFNN